MHTCFGSNRCIAHVHADSLAGSAAHRWAPSMPPVFHTRTTPHSTADACPCAQLQYQGRMWEPRACRLFQQLVLAVDYCLRAGAANLGLTLGTTLLQVRVWRYQSRPSTPDSTPRDSLSQLYSFVAALLYPYARAQLTSAQLPTSPTPFWAHPPPPARRNRRPSRRPCPKWRSPWSRSSRSAAHAPALTRAGVVR